MRLFSILVATLFLSAVVSFLVAGRPALQRSRSEHAALLARLGSLEHALQTITPVSYAEAEALREERSRLDELGNRRLDQLTDARHLPPLPGLEEALAQTDLEALGEGQPLRQAIVQWARESELASACLRRLLADLAATGSAELEALQRLEQTTLQLEDFDGIGFELVVLGEMPDVLDLLERFVPGRGEPVLSVTGASLRRVEPGLWSTTPRQLASPPVRLWVRLEAYLRRPIRVGGG